MKLQQSKRLNNSLAVRSGKEKILWALKGLGLVLVVILLLIVFYDVHSRQVTEQRFADTGTVAKVQTYYRAQAAALGMTYSEHDIAKTCYMDQPIGGGPDGGGPELWCGVSVTKTISVPPNTQQIDSILDNLNAVAKEEGMRVNAVLNDAPSSYVRTPNYNSSQLIEYSAGNGNAYDPGGYGCSIDAESNYLPYDSNGDYLLELPGQTSSNYAPNTKQASLYYELKCDGAASYVPAGYIYLK